MRNPLPLKSRRMYGSTLPTMPERQWCFTAYAVCAAPPSLHGVQERIARQTTAQEHEALFTFCCPLLVYFEFPSTQQQYIPSFKGAS